MSETGRGVDIRTTYRVTAGFRFVKISTGRGLLQRFFLVLVYLLDLHEHSQFLEFSGFNDIVQLFLKASLRRASVVFVNFDSENSRSSEAQVNTMGQIKRGHDEN